MKADIVVAMLTQSFVHDLLATTINYETLIQDFIVK